MATGTTLIAKIRDELQDTTDQSFADELLLRYINRGATEFCSTTGCLQKSAYIATDATNFKFTLSSYLTNPVVVYDVEYNGTPLNRTFRHEVTYKFGASSGTPIAWYEFGGSLFIDIIAPVATGASALNAFYIGTPTDLSAVGSTFDFPNEWESAIVSYAIARCFATQRDTVLAAEHMAKYETMRQSCYAINKYKLLGDAT